MTGMNRLSRWIVRRPGPPIAGAAMALRMAAPFALAAGPPPWLDDLRLFLTGWVGGLIFFGTLIG